MTDSSPHQEEFQEAEEMIHASVAAQACGEARRRMLTRRCRSAVLAGWQAFRLSLIYRPAGLRSALISKLLSPRAAVS